MGVGVEYPPAKPEAIVYPMLVSAERLEVSSVGAATGATV